MWSGRRFRLLISSPRWQTDAVSCLRSYSCVGLTISARSHHSLHDVDMPRETRPPGQTFTGAKATGKSSIGRVYAPNTSNLEHRQAAQRPCGSPRAACVIAATTPPREGRLRGFKLTTVLFGHLESTKVPVGLHRMAGGSSVCTLPVTAAKEMPWPTPK